MWAQWVLSLGIAALLIFGLIRFVQSNGSTTPPAQSPSADVQANREAAALVAQDQAPHTARLRPGVAPAAALSAAIRADMVNEIVQQQIYGSLQRSTCAQTGSHAAQRGYTCAVVVNGLPYPFVGVVDLGRRVITYCKRDPPPVPSESVPVSPRCFLAKSPS
jgi:hypothetical protein